jgi:hypothetical protein
MENDILKKYIAVDLEFAFTRIIDNLEGNDNVYINKENYNLDDKTLLKKGLVEEIVKTTANYKLDIDTSEKETQLQQIKEQNSPLLKKAIETIEINQDDLDDIINKATEVLVKETMEDLFPHDITFNIGELKEFSNYLNEKLDKEPIFTKDEIDNDKSNYFKGQEMEDETLENIYKANSNAKANLAREELNHIFINFEIDCLDEINSNVLSKNNNDLNKMKLDVDDKTSIKEYLESDELEKLLNDNIQKLVDEKVGLGLPVIMERYSNYSLANNGIIDEEDIKNHKITDDDIKKSFEIELKNKLKDVKEDILDFVKTDDEGEYILINDMDKLQTKYSDNLEKSNEKLSKLEKEVGAIEKHKNEKEKEIGGIEC